MQVENRPSLLAQLQAKLDETMPNMPPLPPIDAYTDAQPARTHAGGVSLLRASDVVERPIHWLWPGWLARGKLIILAGSAGTGKTTLALGLAATVTTGGRWPDGLMCAGSSNVLVWSSEDDVADTLKPRLMACGADVTRIYFVQGVTDEQGEVLPFDPSRDIPTLNAAVSAIGGASLLIVDPIVSAVAGDMHRANDVRRGLQALVDFAESYNCAVLGITHFAKGSAGSSPQERVIGSQAFGALARTVLVAAKEEDSDTRVLARAKSNISIDEGGVTYTIEPYALESGIETTRVMWGGKIEGTARDILGAVEAPHVDDDDDPIRDVDDALRRLLRDGPVNGKKAKAVMSESGYTEKQIRGARERLDVSTVRDGFGTNMKTFWSLLDKGKTPFVPSELHSCPLPGVGTNGEKGHEWGVDASPEKPEGAQENQKMLTQNSERLQEDLSAFGKTEVFGREVF